jgi:acyl-CoA thioesterase
VAEQALPPWPPELESLQAELDAVLRGSALLRALGGELVGWGPGWAETTLETAPEHGNLAGTVHGGIVGAVADAAFEVACNSHGRLAVAASLSAHFTAPAELGTTLTAVASEVARGRRIASYRIDVTTSDGTLAAWFQALAHRTSRWHLGEERWPADWRAER